MATPALTPAERQALDDLTSPYPCYVCRVPFKSRKELATHPHPEKAVSK